MSYLSSGAQLLGNLEHTAAELLETTMQERGARLCERQRELGGDQSSS